MKIEIGILTSLIALSITIATFFINNSKNLKKETADNQYKQGVLDQQLKYILEKLDKIERKLDTFDVEVEKKIEKHIKQHEDIFHNIEQGGQNEHQNRY